MVVYTFLEICMIGLAIWERYMIIFNQIKPLLIVFSLLQCGLVSAMESSRGGCDYPIVHIKSELARLAGGLYRLSGELNGLVAEFEGLKRYVDQLNEPPAYKPNVGVFDLSPAERRGVLQQAIRCAQIGSVARVDYASSSVGQSDEPIDKTAFKGWLDSGSSSSEE